MLYSSSRQRDQHTIQIQVQWFMKSRKWSICLSLLAELSVKLLMMVICLTAISWNPFTNWCLVTLLYYKIWKILMSSSTRVWFTCLRMMLKCFAKPLNSHPNSLMRPRILNWRKVERTLMLTMKISLSTVSLSSIIDYTSVFKSRLIHSLMDSMSWSQRILSKCLIIKS